MRSAMVTLKYKKTKAMKKFFLDQFAIKHINYEQNGNIKLHCLGSYLENDITFFLSLTKKEFYELTQNLSEQGIKIKKLLSTAFFSGIQNISKTILVDTCWLTIKVVELTDTHNDLDKEYNVENYGFIPA